MPYEINGPTPFYFCSPSNTQHCTTSYSIRTWPVSLWTNAAVSEQWWNTGGCYRRRNVHGWAARKYCRWTGRKQRCRHIMESNISPTTSSSIRVGFWQFRIGVMWQFECLNLKRYKTENKRHYFTTNLRIILPLFPIEFSAWKTDSIENLSRRTTNSPFSGSFHKNILKITHRKTFRVYQHDTQAPYCSCLPHICKFFVCLMRLSLMKPVTALQRNSYCYYRLPCAYRLLTDATVKWIQDPNTVIKLTCNAEYSTTASFTTHTQTFYEISCCHGHMSQEVRIGSYSTLLDAQQEKSSREAVSNYRQIKSLNAERQNFVSPQKTYYKSH